MSRDINLNKPLTVQDKAYLRSRTREHEIAVNERQFGPGGEGALPDRNNDGEVNILDIDQDIADHVLALDEQELKTKIIKAGLDATIDPDSEDSPKDQLIEILAIHYQLNRNAKLEEKAKEDAAAKARAEDSTK